MEALENMLLQHIELVEEIGNNMERREPYLEKVKEYLPRMNQMITEIFKVVQDPAAHFNINEEFVLQVLKDIVYGIEQEDPVFLLDVLRYGLLELYYYIGMELQGAEA